MGRCVKLLEAGQGAALLPDLRQLVKKQPSDTSVRFFLGRAYAQGEMYREAAAEFELAATRNRKERAIDPSELAGALASSYERLGRFKEAQGVLLLELKRSPLSCGLLVQVAEIFQRRGMPGHASDYMAMALKIDPENPDLLLRMAVFLEYSGDLKGVLEYAKKVLEIRAGDADACRIAARVYYNLSNYPKAMEYYSILARMPGFRASGLKGKAECLYAHGSRILALAAFEEALQAAGGDVDMKIPLLYRIGMLYIKEGEVLRGVEYLGEVEKRSPGYKDAGATLSRYTAFSNDRSLAAYAFSRDCQFYDLACKMLDGLGFSCHKYKQVKKRDLVFYASRETDEKYEHIYFYFSRKLTPMDERELREIVNEVRLVRMKQGVVYGPGGYTRQAVEYAESRALTLISREELASQLAAAGGCVEVRAAGGG